MEKHNKSLRQIGRPALYFLLNKCCFRRLLERDLGHVAALKGVAEALISQAADYLEQNIDPNVVDNCREAVAALTSAAALRPEVTCLWRLMGDALTLMRPLPEEVIAPFEVPGRLAGRTEQSTVCLSHPLDGRLKNCQQH